MKKIRLLIIGATILFFTSCSKHIYVNFQTESANTGKVIIRPSKPTQNTFVTINENLIVNKKNVKSVTINNVPNGDHKINYTSENGWYKEKLNGEITIKMENGKEITKLVQVPPYSNGYWIYISGLAILSGVLLLTK